MSLVDDPIALRKYRPTNVLRYCCAGHDLVQSSRSVMYCNSDLFSPSYIPYLHCRSSTIVALHSTVLVSSLSLITPKQVPRAVRVWFQGGAETYAGDRGIDMAHVSGVRSQNGNSGTNDL